MFESITSAQNLALVGLAALNVLLLWVYWATTPKWCRWTFPATIIAIEYALNYPLRALYLAYIGDAIPDTVHQAYELNDLIAALSYATAFFGMLMLTTVVLIRRYLGNVSESGPQELGFRRGFSFYANVLTIILVFAVGIRYRDLQIVGFTGEETAGTFTDTLLDNLMALQWAGIFAAAVLIWKLGQKWYGVHLAFLVLLIVGKAAVLTEKGSVFVLAIVYLISEQYIKMRSRRWVVVLLMVIAIANSMYSYMIRSIGDFRGVITKDTVALNANAAVTNRDELWQMGPYLISRFNLVDNLVYTMKRADVVSKGYYKYGTAIEVLNLIPRAIWPSRPFLYFNYFVVEQIFGLPYGSSDSIGRIGESYFLLGYFGVIAAVGYGAMFFLIFYRLWCRTDVLYKKILFINFMALYGVHDAYLFQGLTPLLFTTIVISVIAILSPKDIKIQSNGKEIGKRRVPR